MEHPLFFTPRVLSVSTWLRTVFFCSQRWLLVAHGMLLTTGLKRLGFSEFIAEPLRARFSMTLPKSSRVAKMGRYSAACSSTTCNRSELSCGSMREKLRGGTSPTDLPHTERPRPRKFKSKLLLLNVDPRGQTYIARNVLEGIQIHHFI